MSNPNETSFDSWSRLRVDRSATTPLYLQIANTIRHRIATNEMRALSRVPSVRRMARFAEVTPATIARAYQVLQAEGLLETLSGSGTVIADVRQIENEARARSGEALARAIDNAITPLLNMQFSPEEVLEAVEERLRLSYAANLVVVAAAAPVADKYARYLNGRLKGKYDIKPVLVGAIKSKDPATVELLRHCDRCVTLLSLHQVVRELLAPYGIPISILLTQLSLDTLRELEDLSSRPGVRVGVVAEEYYRPSVLATVGQYFAPDRILAVVDLRPEALRRKLAGVDLCIHTLGAQEMVVNAGLKQLPTLELKFEVRQDSLERFLSFVSTGQQATQSAAL